MGEGLRDVAAPGERCDGEGLIVDRFEVRVVEALGRQSRHESRNRVGQTHTPRLLGGGRGPCAKVMVGVGVVELVDGVQFPPECVAFDVHERRRAHQVPKLGALAHPHLADPVVGELLIEGPQVQRHRRRPRRQRQLCARLTLRGRSLVVRQRLRRIVVGSQGRPRGVDVEGASTDAAVPTSSRCGAAVPAAPASRTTTWSTPRAGRVNICWRRNSYASASSTNIPHASGVGSPPSVPVRGHTVAFTPAATVISAAAAVSVSGVRREGRGRRRGSRVMGSTVTPRQRSVSTPGHKIGRADEPSTVRSSLRMTLHSCGSPIPFRVRLNSVDTRQEHRRTPTRSRTAIMHQHLTTTALLASEATDRGIALGLTIVLLVVAAAVALLWIAAVVSIVRSLRYTTAGKALWVLVIIALPILGALGWFIWGRHAQSSIFDGLTVDRPAQR